MCFGQSGDSKMIPPLFSSKEEQNDNESMLWSLRGNDRPCFADLFPGSGIPSLDQSQTTKTVDADCPVAKSKHQNRSTSDSAPLLPRGYLPSSSRWSGLVSPRTSGTGAWQRRSTRLQGSFPPTDLTCRAWLEPFWQLSHRAARMLIFRM